MLSAGKLYRREDLEQANSNSLNAGQGHKGQNYNMFKYKGGVNCHHYYMREIYIRKGVKIDVNSPLAKSITPARAKQLGFKIPKQPTEVAQKPINMLNNGHHPSYKA